MYDTTAYLNTNFRGHGSRVTGYIKAFNPRKIQFKILKFSVQTFLLEKKHIESCYLYQLVH